MCVTSIPESQMSVGFAIRPVVFELQAILKQVHRMPANDFVTLQGQKVPRICATSVPQS